ncbi:RloB family protein [Chitinophaga filiformis]|uniref:RloB family protein n=1 Tax=Chitinophaga filiformis TaxID=104663 RepID=UPI001F29EDA5|nr:RloB family protein [Chitinophaga filiformis]MCF6404131.1 RloB family protein [Chitinophaga filiformis]
MGLFNNACRRLIPSKDNLNPSYPLNDEDEVWFIIDTDDWGKEILELRENIAKHPNWFVAQSNQCFEVWLYYHFHKNRPTETVKNWKEFLNTVVKGGFNTKKHPIYLEEAIINAENNYSINEHGPEIFCTEVFHLGKRILPLVQDDINLLLP